MPAMELLLTGSHLRLVPHWPLGLAVLALCLPFIVVAPLAAYVLLIAVFGLPHVLCELRYCDERFSHRLRSGTLRTIGICLAGIALVRIAVAAKVLPGALAVYAELGLGAALVLAASASMARWRWVGLAAGLAMVAGIVAAPIATFLVFAWLHNLTPLAFVAEISPKASRARTVAFFAVPFLVVPALVASGLPAAWMGAVAPAREGLSLFGAGQGPLAAFLPHGLSGDRAYALFAAAVAAQVMHYFSVIVIMPALLRAGGSSPGLVTWPSWPLFYGAVALAALVVVAIYALDYAFARNLYGVAAALHSWIELPLFVLALGAGLTALPESARPVPTRSR